MRTSAGDVERVTSVAKERVALILCARNATRWWFCAHSCGAPKARESMVHERRTRLKDWPHREVWWTPALPTTRASSPDL